MIIVPLQKEKNGSFSIKRHKVVCMVAARGIIKTELWFHVYHVERYMHAVTSENDSFRAGHKAHNNQVKKKK